MQRKYGGLQVKSNRASEIKLSGKLLGRLKKTIEKVNNIAFAAIIGSIVRQGKSFHDIDIAVKVADLQGKYETFCKVLQEIASLGISEEAIDIVDLDRADIEMEKEVAVNSIVLLDKVGYKQKLVKRINMTYTPYREMLDRSVKEWLSSEDPSSINASMVNRKFNFIKSELTFLKQNVLAHTQAEVKTSPVLSRLLERSYQLIIEATLDICRHIVSAMGWGPALSHTDCIKICEERKVVSKELAEKLLQATRSRNIIVHRYLNVDYDTLYKASKELKNTIPEFEKQIVRFIRKTSS
jgi:uncharacterized protein YutE (UPF0331/DUF86 family)/predicted nucleotidyltransferase